MIDEIRELFEYTSWADGRVLDAVAKLDAAAFEKELGSSFPSIRATLVHVLSADWVWLARWQGHSPAGIPGDWDLSSFAAIRSRWEEIRRERAAFVAGLSDADLARPLAYRNIRGESFVNTFAEMLRHVVNHSTYHRGQVITMLRQLGAEGVSTDLIAFYRLRPSGQVPAAG